MKVTRRLSQWWLWTGLGLAVAAAAQVPASGPVLATLPAPLPGYVFPSAQTLSYLVDWRVFPAGTASIHLERQGDSVRVSASGETVSALNLLFRVSDKFQSSFDRKTGCSGGFSKQVIEGRRQVNTELKFDYGRRKALWSEKNVVSGTNKQQEAEIPGCVTDLLSGIFYAPTQPLEVGQSFQMPVADAVHTVVVTMKVEGREDVKTPLATYKTLRVRPTADAGAIKKGGEMWIWYTDDARHLPVQMRARLFWGTLTMRLSGLEGK